MSTSDGHKIEGHFDVHKKISGCLMLYNVGFYFNKNQRKNFILILLEASVDIFDVFSSQITQKYTRKALSWLVFTPHHTQHQSSGAPLGALSYPPPHVVLFIYLH